jgi:hypothetical protein
MPQLDREELLLPNSCQLTKCLRHRPQIFLGEAIHVSGLLGSDYNLLLQNLFRSAVSTPPNEDWEMNTAILYLTHSQATAARLHDYAERNKAPAVDVVIKTFHSFDSTETLDLMADLEDDTREVKLVIVEDIDGYEMMAPIDSRIRVRNMRRAAAKNFVFVASGFLAKDASTLKDHHDDSEDFLKHIWGRGYERPRGIDTEYDVSLYTAPVGYDKETLEVYQDVIIGKCRGALAFDRDVITRTSYEFGNY